MLDRLLLRLSSEMAFGSLLFFVFTSFLLLSGDTQATKAASPACRIRTFLDIAASQEDLCYPHLLEDNCTPRVLQVAGRDVHKALSMCRKRNCIYCASLFYAEWCPFSMSTRQIFDQLSILFPDICHLAVESSGFWPSEISEHGVRSLPTLYLHNKTSRFEFHGRRCLDTLSQFYEEKTGLVGIPLSFYLGEVQALPKKLSAETSWKNWLTVWIWDDFYLAFAFFFVMLRSFMYFQPKLVATFKYYWHLKGMPSRPLVRSPVHKAAEQRKRRALVAERSNNRYLRKDDRDTGKGVLSVSSWPSSSFAAVALTECSSRSVTTDDTAKKTAISLDCIR